MIWRTASGPRLKRLRRRPTGRDFIKRLIVKGGAAGGPAARLKVIIVPERRYVLRR